MSIRTKHQSYKRVFDYGVKAKRRLSARIIGFFGTRKQYYKQVFAGEAGQRVLGDLAKFCHANTTTHVPGDPNGSAQLEGRRQVFLRIQAMCNLTGEQIAAWERNVKQEEYELD